MNPLSFLTGGGSYVVYAMIGVALGGAVVVKANHDKNRGIAICEAERAKDEAEAKAKAEAIKDASEQVTEIIEEVTEDLTENIRTEDMEAINRARDAKRLAAYWRQQYETLSETPTACGPVPLDDDYRMLNDQARARVVGGGSPDSP